MMFSGCGKVNDQAPALNSTGSHPANWRTSHRVAYRQTPDQCRECHGSDLKGGVVKVDCFNQAGLGQCHAGGHGPRSIIHPVPFTDPSLHGPMARADLIVCQGCHGEAKGAGGNPRFTVPFGSIPYGCESSGCHNAKMAHPKPWKSHPSAGNKANACALCHGAAFDGGAGPACNSCHTRLVAGTIPVSGQCSSCHANPPDGVAAPNRAGSHAAHLALPMMAGNCAACHSGGGSGAASHGTTLTVTFAATVAGNAGPAAFNGSTCANISCHGGQVTPAWGTTLDVLASCTFCHQPGGENISNNSGRHGDHQGFGVACTDCHDMTNSQAHFGNVTTRQFETQPSTTLRSFINYSKPTQSCSVSMTNPPPAGVSFTTCHSDTRSWNGVNKAVKQ
jgi:predicted CxxxxCH...CXXCH cytochrome family protein